MKKLLFIIVCFFIQNYASAQSITINFQSVGKSICVGDTLELLVDASSTLPLTYQWKKNGADLPGAVTSVLALNGVVVADEAVYSCSVMNSSDTIESEPINILVVTAAPVILSQDQGAVACNGDNVSLGVSVSGLLITYQWQKNGSDIQGEVGNYLQMQNVSSTDNGAYTCFIENACGYISSDPALVMVNSVPQIITQPQNDTICIGLQAQIFVTASGSGLNYQWRKNGVDISGANNYVYTFSNVQLSDAGSYSCIVWNNCDTITSYTAVLSIGYMPDITAQPISAAKCAGENASFYTSLGGGTPPFYYNWMHNGVSTGITVNSITVSNIEASDAGYYYCAMTSVCGTFYSDSALLTVKQSPSIVTQPETFVGCEGDTASFEVKAAGAEPLMYQWKKQTINVGGATESIYNIPGIDIGDVNYYSCLVTNACGSILSDTAYLLVKPAPHAYSISPLTQSMCEGNAAQITVQSPVPASQFGFTWLKDGDFYANAHESITISNVAGSHSGNYQCVVHNICGSDTSDVSVLNVKTIPSFTVQPADTSLCPGQTALFTASVTGTEPIQTLWYYNGQALSGETTGVLMIPNVTSDHMGSYYMFAINSCDTAFSNFASLVVNTMPSLTVNNPWPDRNKCEHDTVSLTVHAGGGELIYQWYFNNNPIPSETDSIISTNDATLGNTGSFHCIITNNCGSISSDTMRLFVHDRPEIDLGSDISVCSGDTAVIFGGYDPDWIYYWNGQMSEDSAKIVTVSGQYILEVKTNQYYCSSSDTINVVINASIPFSIGADTAVCDSYVLNAGVQAISYNWNNGQGTGASFTVTQTGTYTLEVTATGGCTTRDTVNVSVYPSPVFDLGSDVSITTKDTLVLHGPAGYQTYHWNNSTFDSTLTLYGADFVNNTGTFAYVLTVTDNICSYTDAVNVTIILNSIEDIVPGAEINIYPNPSVDGKFNFELTGINAKDYKLEVFNAIGQIVDQTMIHDSGLAVKQIIDLSVYESGVYYIRLITANGDALYSQKLIIK